MGLFPPGDNTRPSLLRRWMAWCSRAMSGWHRSCGPHHHYALGLSGRRDHVMHSSIFQMLFRQGFGPLPSLTSIGCLRLCAVRRVYYCAMPAPPSTPLVVPQPVLVLFHPVDLTARGPFGKPRETQGTGWQLTRASTAFVPLVGLWNPAPLRAITSTWWCRKPGLAYPFADIYVIGGPSPNWC